MKFSFFKTAQETDVDTGEAIKPPNAPIKIDITELNPKIKDKNLPLYNKILFLLNSSIYYMTNGEVTFKKLKDTNFTFDLSKYSKPEVGQLFNLCKMFYLTTFGNTQLDAMLALANSMVELKNKELTNYIGSKFKPQFVTFVEQAKRYESYLKTK